jgi:aldehyde dehydrogenase (NAD+)
MEINQFYINGNFVDPIGQEKIDLINPATERKVGHVVTGVEQDVDAAVSAAKAAFNEVSLLTLEQKKVILQEIIDGCRQEKKSLLKLSQKKWELLLR